MSAMSNSVGEGKFLKNVVLNVGGAMFALAR
jgi:hypothetical protein